MEGWAEAYNSADPDRASQFIHLPLVVLPPPPDPDTLVSGMLPALTSVEEIGRSSRRMAATACSTRCRLSAMPTRCQATRVTESSRPSLDTPEKVGPNLRVGVLYLLTEVDCRLGIK